MNAWQTAMEARRILAELAWPEGAQEPVFGPESVSVVAGPPDGDLMPGGFPFAMIFVGNGTPDPDEPLLETRTFNLALVQMQEGDPLGEQAIIGGPRDSQEIGTSRGRGILEIASLVRTAIGKMTGWDGLPITYTNEGSPQTAVLNGMHHLASVSPSFSGLCTVDLDYPGPFNVSRSGDTVSWEPVAAKSGFVTYSVVASVGPVDHPSQGTILEATTGLSATSVDIGLADTICIFAGYSLVGGTTPQVYSRTERGTYRG